MTTIINNEMQTDLALQTKILNEANEDFLSVYNMIREELTKEENNTILTRFKIGELIANMDKDEQTYGSKSIERMELVIGKDRNIIYQSKMFFDRYSQTELENLLKLRDKADQPLLWSHVTCLMRIQDDDEREKMTQVILDNALTPTQLLTYVQKKQGKGRQSKAGRSMARPKSLKAFVDQQYTMIDQLLRRKSKVWAGTEKQGDKSFFDVLEETPTDKIDHSLLNDFEELAKLYERSANESKTMAEAILVRKKMIEEQKKQEAKKKKQELEEQEQRIEKTLDEMIDEDIEDSIQITEDTCEKLDALEEIEFEDPIEALLAEEDEKPTVKKLVKTQPAI